MRVLALAGMQEWFSIARIRDAHDLIMCILHFSPLVIVFFHFLVATSLPEDFFLTDDTRQPEMFSLADAELNHVPSDSSDFISDMSLDADNTNLFSTPSENDLGFGNSLASAQWQSSCQADNDLTNGLQGRDTGPSTCGPRKEDAPLDLPLDLFNDPIKFLRGNLPPEESASQDDADMYQMLRDLFGEEKQERDPQVWAGKCVVPFIYNLCCNGPLGESTKALILNIYECHASLGFCDTPFEACCLLFVGGPSSDGMMRISEYIMRQLRTNIFLRIWEVRLALLVMQYNLKIQNNVGFRTKMKQFQHLMSTR